MIPFAIIRNPLSCRNRSIPSPTLPNLFEPTSGAQLNDVLARLRDDGTQLLTVDGGDGTVREIMTALVALGWGPRLAVLPSGKINLIAGDVGWPSRRPADVMAAAQAGWDGFAIERRQLLRLDRTGAAPAFGMFVGAAAFTAGWKLANRHLHPRGLTSGAAIAAALLLTLARAGRLSHGEPMTVTMDDGPPRHGNRFLLLATTLDRLALGLWPFWEQDGVGGLHVLDVTAPPRRLLVALPALARGRPKPWMAQAGYHSANAISLTIRTEAPVILDGEAFAPGPDNIIRLSAGPVMEFARP